MSGITLLFGHILSRRVTRHYTINETLHITHYTINTYTINVSENDFLFVPPTKWCEQSYFGMDGSTKTENREQCALFWRTWLLDTHWSSLVTILHWSPYFVIQLTLTTRTRSTSTNNLDTTALIRKTRLCTGGILQNYVTFVTVTAADTPIFKRIFLLLFMPRFYCIYNWRTPMWSSDSSCIGRGTGSQVDASSIVVDKVWPQAWWVVRRCTGLHLQVIRVPVYLSDDPLLTKCKTVSAVSVGQCRAPIRSGWLFDPQNDRWFGPGLTIVLFFNCRAAILYYVEFVSQ